MAGGAQGLQVAPIPEQGRIAPVGDLVVHHLAGPAALRAQGVIPAPGLGQFPPLRPIAPLGGIRPGRGRQAFLTVLNVLSSEQPVEYETGELEVLPWGTPLEYQLPRRWEVGLRFEF